MSKHTVYSARIKVAGFMLAVMILGMFFILAQAKNKYMTEERNNRINFQQNVKQGVK